MRLPESIRSSRTCVFQHDAETPLARVVADKPDRYRAVPVAVEDLAGVAEAVARPG